MENKKRLFFGLDVHDNSTPKNLIKVVILLWLVAWIGALLYTDYWAERGQFGDMFGAVNALFSGFAFAGIVYTILLQKSDSDQQKEELRNQGRRIDRQQFESSFFYLFDRHTRRVDNNAIYFNGNQYEGADIFEKLFEGFQIMAVIEAPEEELQYASALEKAYEDIMSDDSGRALVFAADYLRSLYQLIDFIDGSNLLSDEKDKYLRILATSLSHVESTVLAYVLAFSARDYVEEYIILNRRTGFPNFLKMVRLSFPNADRFNTFIQKRMFI